uniref:Uncharacterized protein n=1 Tax=Solanum lycopersicum TaxID=4081 RepID=K4D1V5_SOLLC
MHTVQPSTCTKPQSMDFVILCR